MANILFCASKRNPRWHFRFASVFVALLPMQLSRYSTEAFSFVRHGSASRLIINPSFCRPYDRGCVRCQSTTSEVEYALAQKIAQAYTERETDGVVEFAVSSALMTDLELEGAADLVPAILEASKGEKGVTASIMNSLIGSALVVANSSDQIGCASDKILSLMNMLEEEAGVVPDIVTYSLAYQVLAKDPDDDDMATEMLGQAERRSKKIAGGKRRKLLASARRKPIVGFKDAEEDLKGLLGGDFKVLLEAEEFAVIHKPSGVPCFHKKTTTAGKLKRGKGKKKGTFSDISLEDALIACNVELSTLNPEALGLVHRLDRGSSGCLVLAKTNEMHTRLLSEFFLRRTTKKYIALLQHSLEASLAENSVIEAPVGRRPAKSEYRVLERYRKSDEPIAALVEFEIFTGRKHQIRVHAADVLKSPVWGDPCYGQDHSNPIGDESERMFLHASNLIIPHLDIDVESPVPSWWDETTSTFDEI